MYSGPDSAYVVDKPYGDAYYGLDFSDLLASATQTVLSSGLSAIGLPPAPVPAPAPLPVVQAAPLPVVQAAPQMTAAPQAGPGSGLSLFAGMSLPVLLGLGYFFFRKKKASNSILFLLIATMLILGKKIIMAARKRRKTTTLAKRRKAPVRKRAARRRSYKGGNTSVVNIFVAVLAMRVLKSAITSFFPQTELKKMLGFIPSEYILPGIVFFLAKNKIIPVPGLETVALIELAGSFSNALGWEGMYQGGARPASMTEQQLRFMQGRYQGDHTALQSKIGEEAYKGMYQGADLRTPAIDRATKKMVRTLETPYSGGGRRS